MQGSSEQVSEEEEEAALQFAGAVHILPCSIHLHWSVAREEEEGDCGQLQPPTPHLSILGAAAGVGAGVEEEARVRQF